MTILRVILQLTLLFLFAIVFTSVYVDGNPEVVKLLTFTILFAVLFLLTFQLKSKGKSTPNATKSKASFIKWMLSLIGLAALVHGFEILIDPSSMYSTQNRYRLLNQLIEFTANNFGVLAGQILGFILWASLGSFLIIIAFRIHRMHHKRVNQ